MFEYQSWRESLYWLIIIGGIAFSLDITVFAEADNVTRFGGVPALALWCWCYPSFLRPVDWVVSCGRLAIALGIMSALWVHGVAMYQWQINTAREFPQRICNKDESDCRDLMTYWGEKYKIWTEQDGKKQLHIEKEDISMFTAVDWYLRHRHTKRPLDIPVCMKDDPKADPKCADDKDDG